VDRHGLSDGLLSSAEVDEEEQRRCRYSRARTVRVGYVRVMAILIRYAPSSLTREQYDKVNEILQENGPEGPPPPLQLHVMFGEEPDLRVSEIWESESAWQQAWDGGLKAALSTVGIELPEPERFPVHEVWGSRVRE
jgi:hypothetical protein